LGAGISAVSMVPYIGDAAKLGKLGKWSKTIDRAIDVASKAPKSAMAKAMRPAIAKIADGLNAIPATVLNKLSASAKKQIIELRAKANGFLADRSVHVINGGGKGAWNKALNKPLEKNADYLVNGYTYKTDNLGRIKSVEGELILSKAERAKYQQNKVGKSGNAGDEGGHLIASIFNGPGEKLNLVPMNGNFNKTEFRNLERTFANAIASGKKVNIKIDVIHSGSSVRPDGFAVNYVIDGIKKNAFMNNAVGG
jgi:DNA/RNA non-specific endonuclease